MWDTLSTIAWLLGLFPLVAIFVYIVGRMIFRSYFYSRYEYDQRSKKHGISSK